MAESEETGMSDMEASGRVGAALESVLRDIGIPPRPAILDRIREEMRKQAPDLKQLAMIISSDVALSAALISLVNSPYFGYRGRVRCVDEALNMIGLSVASRSIAGIVFRRLFPQSPTLTRFWDASAAIARLSGWLVQQLDVPIHADDAYTFGLFRDCGIAILIARFPDYPEVLQLANQEDERNFTAVEEARCPTNHAVVGCMLAQGWWLPEEICLAIRHHQEYPPSGQQNPSALGMIAIAQLAEHLWQYHTGMSETREWAKARAFCLSFLGLDEARLAQLYRESAALIEKTY